VLVPWTALQPSARERRWRLAGQLGGFVALAATFVALSQGGPLNPLLAVALIAAAVGLSWPRRPVAWQLGIDEGGRILARRPDASPERHLQCVFAAPWLVTFRVGRKLVPVWPDALPAESYRRLWVYLRWGLERSPAVDAARAEDGR
jgi:hypothetical protein